MALSWPKLPRALKAAIGALSRVHAPVHGQNSGVQVSLVEAKAACQRWLGRAQGLPMTIRPGF